MDMDDPRSVQKTVSRLRVIAVEVHIPTAIRLRVCFACYDVREMAAGDVMGSRVPVA